MTDDRTKERNRAIAAIRRERTRQIMRYGYNDDLDFGTGPGVSWLTPISHIDEAQRIQARLRDDYEAHVAVYGSPTWMHLVREEIAEAFQESDPELLAGELIQVAALCVSWLEQIYHD